MTSSTSRPRKIISGGQTGVDRAALDVALALSIEHGGWCPAGRRAEDGAIDARYQLSETESSDYAVRTEWNVRDSDGTLVLTRGEPSGGTALTCSLARRLGRPLLIVDLTNADAERSTIEAVRQWLAGNQIEVLNIAGPRESQSPGIAIDARELLPKVLEED